MWKLQKQLKKQKVKTLSNVIDVRQPILQNTILITTLNQPMKVTFGCRVFLRRYFIKVSFNFKKAK